MTVSARKNQNLYVLAKDHFYWLTTLSTNRRDCWSSVAKYADKRTLQQKGYMCIRVRLEGKS